MIHRAVYINDIALCIGPFLGGIAIGLLLLASPGGAEVSPCQVAAGPAGDLYNCDRGKACRAAPQVRKK